MSGAQTQRIGRAGEFFVISDLTLKGFEAYHANQVSPYDVICDDGTGKLHRVQVKSTTKMRKKADAKNYYQFNIHHYSGSGYREHIYDSEFDVIAFVFLDIWRIAYVRAEELSDGENKMMMYIRFRLKELCPRATGRVIEDYETFPYESVPF